MARKKPKELSVPTATVSLQGRRIPISGDPDEVIYSWGVRSDNRAVQYEIILRRNGEVSCDCPGWVFKRKNQERGCKHVNAMFIDEINRIRAMFGAGEPLPTFEVPEPPKKSKAFVPGDTGIKLRARRLITID